MNESVSALNAWKIAAGYENIEVIDRSAPKVVLTDRGAEANRAQRRELLNVLVNLPSVSSDCFLYVLSELGLDGDFEKSAKPLEARQVRKLINDVECRSAVERAEAVKTGVEVTRRLLDESFAKGVELEIQTVFVELAKVVPASGTDAARQAALDVLREEIQAHLKEVRQMSQAVFMQLSDDQVGMETVQRAVSEVGVYARACCDQFRNVAMNAKSEVVFRQAVELKKTFVILTGLITFVEVAVKFRAEVVKYMTELKIAARKVLLAEMKSRLEKVRLQLEQMLDAFLSLLEAEKKTDACEAALDKMRHKVLELDFDFNMEAVNERIDVAISGYVRRVEDRLNKVREEITGHKIA